MNNHSIEIDTLGSSMPCGKTMIRTSCSFDILPSENSANPWSEAPFNVAVYHGLTWCHKKPQSAKHWYSYPISGTGLRSGNN